MNLNKSKAYWQGKEPKKTEALNKQIKEAVIALEQWIDAANISNSEDGIMIYAQIFWLKELLKLSKIELI